MEELPEEIRRPIRVGEEVVDELSRDGYHVVYLGPGGKSIQVPIGEFVRDVATRFGRRALLGLLLTLGEWRLSEGQREKKVRLKSMLESRDAGMLLANLREAVRTSLRRLYGDRGEVLLQWLERRYGELPNFEYRDVHLRLYSSRAPKKLRPERVRRKKSSKSPSKDVLKHVLSRILKNLEALRSYTDISREDVLKIHEVLAPHAHRVQIRIKKVRKVGRTLQYEELELPLLEYLKKRVYRRRRHDLLLEAYFLLKSIAENVGSSGVSVRAFPSLEFYEHKGRLIPITGTQLRALEDLGIPLDYILRASPSNGAALLKLSPETIRRNIQALEDLGIPLDYILRASPSNVLPLLHRSPETIRRNIQALEDLGLSLDYILRAHPANVLPLLHRSPETIRRNIRALERLGLPLDYILRAHPNAALSLLHLSPDTIRRNIRALEDLGIPLDYILRAHPNAVLPLLTLSPDTIRRNIRALERLGLPLDYILRAHPTTALSLLKLSPQTVARRVKVLQSRGVSIKELLRTYSPDYVLLLLLSDRRFPEKVRRRGRRGSK